MRFQVNPTVRWLWPLNLVVCLWLTCTTSYAEPPAIPEYQVKAGFLLKFVMFVTYPKEAFLDANLNICVLGEDPFEGFLDTLIEDAKNTPIQGRTLKVRYFRKIQAASGCQALFVSQSEQQWFETIMAQVKSRPILTVSDITDFTIHGGMIQLYTTGNKVSFIIEPSTVIEAGLKMSSQLLQVAKSVKKPQ